MLEQAVVDLLTALPQRLDGALDVDGIPQLVSPSVVTLVGDFDFSRREAVRSILDQLRDPAVINRGGSG
jgi:hypothetical protein